MKTHVDNVKPAQAALLPDQSIAKPACDDLSCSRQNKINDLGNCNKMNAIEKARDVNPIEDATKGPAVGRIVSVTGSQAIALVYHRPDVLKTSRNCSLKWAPC